MKKLAVYEDETPDITIVAEHLRQLDKRDYRLAIKVSKMQRKVDKLYAKLCGDDDDAAGDLVKLGSREYKQAIRLAEAMRKASLERTKAELIQKKAGQERQQKALGGVEV